MYIEPNKERLSKLDLIKAKLGDQIMFCPECLFQFDPNTGAKPLCPDCGKGLYTTYVDVELIELRLRYLNESNRTIPEE